ncbi:hypothetical protein G7Z17_g4801 [Cylindrodendrum hubeiense]|uniref:Uncharacterized protein n=1 Tax=Cylindrodendrum hubeiense TaxID=595255 RepID=A0A9P5H852_9HYPO|nr:hypothetical protein G7Z17_g4801 [Cylindrodendrum hubeiense]
MVDLAVSSLALAIFSRTQHNPTAAKEASSRYGRLLRVAQEQITQVRIQKLSDKGLDECLLTVVLMAWYETTTHRPASLTLNASLISLHSWSHHDGAMAILKIWNDSWSHNAPSSIIKQARRGIVRSALLRNLPLPNWIWNGTRFGEHDLDLAFDSILVRVVNLRHAFKVAEQKKRLQVVNAEYLSSEAQELDEACRKWESQIPTEWSYRQHMIPDSKSWSEKEFYSSTVYSYACHGYAAVWMQYFGVRLLLDSTRLGLLQLTYPRQTVDLEFHREHGELTAQLRENSESLSSTIPFSLGRFKLDRVGALDWSHGGELELTLCVDDEIRPALALPAVWPLTMGSSIGSIEPKQETWFRTQLKRLGSVLGDGALECAGTDQWAHDAL